MFPTGGRFDAPTGVTPAPDEADPRRQAEEHKPGHGCRRPVDTPRLRNEEVHNPGLCKPLVRNGALCKRPVDSEALSRTDSRNEGLGKSALGNWGPCRRVARKLEPCRWELRRWPVDGARVPLPPARPHPQR